MDPAAGQPDTTNEFHPPSPGPSQVSCVCPSCHGPLETGGDTVDCGACGRHFARIGEGIDFLGEVTNAHKQVQRAIYEGDGEANRMVGYE